MPPRDPAIRSPPGGDDRPAAVLYTLTLGLTSACFTAVWAYLRARYALLTEAARLHAALVLRRSFVGRRCSTCLRPRWRR